MRSAATTARLRPTRGKADGVFAPKPKKGKADGVRAPKSSAPPRPPRGKSPQAVVKVINSHARGYRAKIVMHYVARSDTDKALPLEDEFGRQIEGAAAIEAVYEEWAKAFERATPGQKRPPRHVTHMILSADCAQTPENARAVAGAVAELLREQLGRDGYRYLTVLHTDTDRPHVHVVINNYQEAGGPKLRLNPPELIALRQQFAQKLRERGIEQEANRRLDRPAVLEAIAAMEAKGPWYLRALQAAPSKDLAPFDALAKRREMARALAKLHRDVKATTLPFSQERREQLAKLREVGKLIDQSAPDSKRLVAELILKIDKDRERVQDHIRALSDPANPVKDIKRRRQREQGIERIIGRNIEAVRAARLDLLRAPGVGVLEGYRLGAQLKAYERELQRIRTLHAFGAEQKAAPGTAAEVAAARQSAAIKARAERTADKLAALGPWYEPTPGRDKGKTFDAFAKRRALVNIATHLTDAMERAGVAAADPLAARVAALRASLIEAPAPDYARLVGALQTRLQDARLRADFDARHAAHQGTTPAARAEILAKVGKELSTRADAMRQARREVAEAPGLPDRERRTLTARLKRMERIARQAGQHAHSPRALATKFAELDRLTAAAAPAQIAPAARSTSPGRSRPVLNFNNEWSVRNDPRSVPQLYAFTARPGAPTQSIDGVPGLSGRTLDGGAGRPESLVPDHALVRLDDQGTASVHELRRPGDGLEAGSGGHREGQGQGREGSSQGREEGRGAADRLTPIAARGDRLNQEQLGALLDRVHARLLEAGAWDDPAPYRSGLREFYEGSDGRTPAPTLDAFAKQRAMLADIDQLKPEVDAAHLNFTPAMRRQLAAIRDLRHDIEAPARDVADVVGRLAQAVTDKQLKIMRDADKPAPTATAMLQRRRQTERTAENSLKSIDAARKAVERAKLPTPQARALVERLKVAAKAMEIYSGKERGR